MLLWLCIFIGCLGLISAGAGTKVCLAACAATLEVCLLGCAVSGPFYPICAGACLAVSAGCVAVCPKNACHHPSAQIQIGQDLTIHASDLVANKEILTLNGITQKVQTGVALNITKTHGHFKFIEITLDNQSNSLKVTTDHVVFKYDNHGNLVLVEAGEVAKGDHMLSVHCDIHGCEKKVMEVTKTTFFHDSTKVYVESSLGTIIADNIFVSSICQGHDIGSRRTTTDFYEEFTTNHNLPDVNRQNSKKRCIPASLPKFTTEELHEAVDKFKV